MRARNCKNLYSIVPDALGFTVRHARVPADWSITGYVMRTIGRVWEPFTPKSAGKYTGPERRGV